MYAFVLGTRPKLAHTKTEVPKGVVVSWSQGLLKEVLNRKAFQSKVKYSPAFPNEQVSTGSWWWGVWARGSQVNKFERFRIGHVETM